MSRDQKWAGVLAVFMALIGAIYADIRSGVNRSHDILFDMNATLSVVQMNTDNSVSEIKDLWNEVDAIKLSSFEIDHLGNGRGRGSH